MASEQTKQQLLQQLDLSDIAQAMCSERYPLPQWQLKDAEVCMQLYKRFLWLKIKHPQAVIVPTKEIDEFWHNHILHTKRYTQDCLALFGHYFHHQPSSADDIAANKLAEPFALTQQLYLAEFDEELLVFEQAI